MANINQLSSLYELSGSDLLAIWNTPNGATRNASLTTLMKYVNDNTTNVTPNTQYASPAANNFNITVVTGNVWLLITPISVFADGSIILPSGAADKDTVTITSTQEVTSLSVTSVAGVFGAPSDLKSNSFDMRYDAVNSTWYRIG